MTELRRIHLIRHGETNWNQERRAQGQQESALTEKGRHQAATLRPLLENINFQDVYCSSSLRTRQTADILFSNRGLTVKHCDQLREIKMGPWEGLLYEDIKTMQPDQFHAFWSEPHKFEIKGAETFAEVQLRAVNRLQQILSESDAQEIAIVSHGVLIKTILCAVESRPLARLWDTPSMHNCARSVIEIHKDGLQRICLYADAPYQSPYTVEREYA